MVDSIPFPDVEGDNEIGFSIKTAGPLYYNYTLLMEWLYFLQRHQ
jgi:hypothetical protein